MKVIRERKMSMGDLDDRGTLLTQNRLRWREFWGEARTRILVWYIVILALTFGIAIPAFRQLLFARVDARIREEMRGEVNDFKELLAGQVSLERLENNRIDDNDDSLTKEAKPISAAEEALVRDLQMPMTEQELKQFFEAYLSVEIPEDNVFLITFVDGTFYESSPKALPEDLKPETVLMQQLATQSESGQGEQVSPNRDISHIFYFVEPIKFNGEQLGTLVIAHTAEEHAEILEAVVAIVQVALAVLFVALLLVWFASGRILQPLRALAITAQSISGSDLTQRIPVRGEGELAKLAATFNTMMDRLESAFVSQRNFVNDAGHELRTPITVIRGYLELMSHDPEDQQETLAIVMDEIDRMSGFVEDLILLARAERPDFLQLETVDVAEVTEEMFEQAQRLATRNWQLEAVAKGKIAVDRQRLIQAVMRLADNAVQYTKMADVIQIGSRICQGKVHFWVQDSGEGIALAHQQRIFDRFARVSDHRRRSDGAGLGLSIVKAIAEAHSGQVILQSQVGVGSTFTVVLPIGEGM